MEIQNQYYMDHAATTPLSKEVLNAMMPYLTVEYGNASTIYMPGQRARHAIDESRRTIAAALSAKPSEIYFTSGGSESDNWALIGAAEAGEKKLRQNAVDALKTSEEIEKIHGHIITDQIEHHAILNTCAYLEERGFNVTYLPVDREGHVDPEAVKEAIRPDTLLVSIMTANNEIGTIEPIQEIGRLLKGYEAETGQRILFHTDAVQAFGHIPLKVSELGVDLMSASAHKLNGPKGVGFLFVRQDIQLPSFVHGGAQERGHRAGTENVAGIIGFAKATEVAMRDMTLRINTEISVRDHMIQRILNEIPDTLLHGDSHKRLPNNINILFEHIEGETLLLLLNEKGVYASAGSACSSGSLDPSHVLLALGDSTEDAAGSIRFTIGQETTIEDADVVIDILKPLVAYLRAC